MDIYVLFSQYTKPLIEYWDKYSFNHICIASNNLLSCIPNDSFLVMYQGDYTTSLDQYIKNKNITVYLTKDTIDNIDNEHKNIMSKANKDIIIITFGTFDLFHLGHINLLQRAKKLGNKLIVGISTDEHIKQYKNVEPVYSFVAREEIISNMKCIHTVFAEESYGMNFEKKKEYIIKYRANIFVMGDDWKGKFDCLDNVCQVVYIPRTTNVSTTEIKDAIRRD